MSHLWDTSTFEITEARLRLKGGLRLTIQRSRHGNWYLVEDESRGAFFRLGPAEYTFVSFLDGTTTISTAMARTCSLLGASALEENQAIELARWLIESGLANTDASVAATRHEAQLQQLEKQQAIQRLNPISVRIPLWNPAKLVETVTRLCGWVFSWPFALVWVFVVVYGLLTAAMDWERLIYGGTAVFSRNGMIWMVGTWLCLKVIHELAHAVACRQLGGKTGDCGILMLLLIPLPYVDVTSTWRFTSKYRRILVSAAGMLAEIFIAAIAAIVWAHSGPGMVAFHASNIMFAASLHTLLFNANPLLKFDGYHILADWLEIPNLASHGQNYLNGQGRKWFFGQPAEPVKYAGLHGAAIKVYGVLAFAWRILLCVVLGMAASNLLHGIGFVIAITAVLLWFVLPVYNFVGYLFDEQRLEKTDRHRFLTRAGAVAGFSLITLFVLPAPSVITAPLVVEYEQPAIVRSDSGGFVKSIEIQPDQVVQKDQLLLTLENPDLQVQLVNLQLKLQEAQIRVNTLQSLGEVAALQMEQESVTALEQQLAEVKKLTDRLNIRAPKTGVVVANQLRNLLGSYVGPGTDILTIGDEGSKSGVALISQADAQHIRNIQGARVSVRLWGQGGVVPGTIQDVNPRGQVDVPHFAFAGTNGGPLNVAQRSQVQNANAQKSVVEDGSQMMLVDARLRTLVRFNTETSLQVRSGQVGQMHLRGRSESLGGWLFSGGWRWLRNNLQVGHGI